MNHIFEVLLYQINVEYSYETINIASNQQNRFHYITL